MLPKKPYTSDDTGAAVAPRIPRDEGLPQLRQLLDPGAMADALARSLPPDASVGDVRIVYLRYKPATRLIVRYRVSIDDAAYDATAFAEPSLDLFGWATDPEHLALARKVDGRAPARTPLAYDAQLDALIQWLPLDLTMPALAAEPAELRALLSAAGVEMTESHAPSELLAYKARRRAVLRLDGHVVKIYAGTDDFQNAVVGLDASGRLQDLMVPARESVIPAEQLTCQILLEGKPPQGPHDAARAAGSALAMLHRLPTDGLRPFTTQAQLAAAASSAKSASAVAPEVADRVTTLLRELELALPDVPASVGAHGDFHGNQVLEVDGSLAVIDFDEICAASAALDFSSYIAHLVNGDAGELEAASGALEDLVAGYGRRPEGLSWYVATSILRRAPFPFRFMDEGWPRRIEQMVSDAEEAQRL